MTVTYTAQVATCRHLGCFWKLLFRWKGSIYKLLWLNMLLYIFLFMALKYSFIYLMNDEQRKTMMDVSKFLYDYEQSIPLVFLLGFYVAIVIERWWSQYLTIPWPDGLAVLVTLFVNGQDVRGRVMRRTIMRYVNLSLVITFSMISPFVKRRFPNYQSYVDIGLLLPSENQRLKELEKRTAHPKHWVPLVWAIAIVARARKEGKITDDVSKDTLIGEINKFRGTCGALLNYDWISIPLVYPQVVSWAVYIYFASSIISHQIPIHQTIIKNDAFILTIPIFPVLEFFFYMGWLLVAETLANPFGEDDDDFDISWLIDRNIQVSYGIADELHNTHPELTKDQYWDDVLPPDLHWNPHTDIDDDGPNEILPVANEKNEDNTKKYLSETNVPVYFAKADVTSRSLDFGSERVIKVYLPPSMSRITFGSRITNRSGMSKGSRPSNDSKNDRIVTQVDNVNDLKSSDGRSKLWQEQAMCVKEDEVLNLTSNSGKRLGDEIGNPEQGTSSQAYKNSTMFKTNYFIYNQNEDLNPTFFNSSSQNVLKINQTRDSYLGDKSSSTIKSDSSFGLHLLLSENIIEKLCEGTSRKKKDEASKFVLLPIKSTNNEINKPSNDEKVLFKSTKSNKNVENYSEIECDNTSAINEKSNRSTIYKSNPIFNLDPITNGIDEIIGECTYDMENEGFTVLKDLLTEKPHKQNDEPQSENIVSQDIRQIAGQSEIAENRSFSPHLDAATVLESVNGNFDHNFIADLLFEDIYTTEISRQHSTRLVEDSNDRRNIVSDKQDISRNRPNNFYFESNANSQYEEAQERTGVIQLETGECNRSELNCIDSITNKVQLSNNARNPILTQVRTILTDFDKQIQANSFDRSSTDYENVTNFENAVPTMDNTNQIEDNSFTGRGVSRSDECEEEFDRNSETNTDGDIDQFEDSVQSVTVLKLHTKDNDTDWNLTTYDSSFVDKKDVELYDFKQRVEESSSLRYRPFSQSQPKFASAILSTIPLPTIIEIPEEQEEDD